MVFKLHILFALLCFQRYFPTSDGLYVSYQRLEDLKVTRSLGGDHWFADSESKCTRFANAVYQSNEQRCKCPHHFPHFFSKNGERYGCYADNQIDDSCLFTVGTEHIINITQFDKCGYIPTDHLKHNQKSLEDGVECSLEVNDIPVLIHNGKEWEIPSLWALPPEPNNDEQGGGNSENQVLGHTELIRSFLRNLIAGGICNRYENHVIISKYDWIIGRLLRVRLSCRQPNDNRIIKGCFVGKALGAFTYAIKKPENPAPTETTTSPTTTTTTPTTTTTTPATTTTTPTTTTTTSTATTPTTTTTATSPTATTPTTTTTTTATSPTTTTTSPTTTTITPNSKKSSTENLAKTTSITPSKIAAVTKNPKSTNTTTTTGNPRFFGGRSSRETKEEDLAVKVALGIGLATIAIILFIIFIVVCRKCKSQRRQRRERRNTQTVEEPDNRSEKSNKYVISSVKSTVPVIQNEEFYMELDLNSVEPEQYADLQTLRRPTNETRKNPPMPSFKQNSNGALRPPSEEGSLSTQTSNFGERYRSTVRRPSADSIPPIPGSEYKNGTFPRLSEGRVIPTIPDFGARYGRGTMRRSSLDALPPIPGSENINKTFPRLTEGRSFPPIPDFGEMYRRDTVRRPSNETIPPIPISRSESNGTLASVSEELNNIPIPDFSKIIPETDQGDSENEGPIYNEIPIYFETYADPSETTK